MVFRVPSFYSYSKIRSIEHALIYQATKTQSEHYRYCLTWWYPLSFQLKIRKRTPKLEIANEEDRDRPPSIGFKPRRNRKLSLVEELAQTYEFDNNELDGNTSEAEIDMMVIPKGRATSFTGNPVRTRAEIPESGTDVLSSLSEMKGEVRREIEVMNMKMTQLEEQISTILSILKTQGHLHSSRGYDSRNDSMDKGRMSSTSYLNDSTPPEEAMKRQKSEERPLPEWLAPESSTDPQESTSTQAATLLNNTANQSTKDSDPRLLQTLNLFKMGKKK